MLTTDNFVRANGLVCRLVEDEVLIVPVRGKVGDLASIYTLKGVGAAVWEALAEPRNMEELTNVIVGKYDVSPKQARVDLEKFLCEMLSAGLCAAVETTG